MGARQSKRSVDITTTPKKDGLPAEGSVAGDAAAPGDGKLERIEETDGKPTTNGTAPHTDVVIDEKDKDKEQEKEKDKDEDNEKEDVKVEDTRPESNTEAPVEGEEVTTPTDGVTPTSPETATSPESKDAKKKDKKKKWSFRSLSFGKRDRSKTAREDAPKNGDVTKEEPLAEGGEEVEAAVPVEESPAEEKTAVSSPIVESTPSPAPVKEEEKAAPAQSPTPVDEKKEEPTPAPTPVPVEEIKEEIEKVEPVVIAEKVEVSPVQAISPVGVTQAQPIATPSIIERKTSEDLPPPLPSSPPPTPIDPSPLQQAQHTAANASALAEALKVPAEAASMASQIAKEPTEVAQSIDESKTRVVTESNIIEPELTSESISVAVTELVTQVQDSIREVEEPQSLKECEIVAEVVKTVESLSEPSSELETITNLAEIKIAETESKDIIIENGVSGQDSASLENIVSLTDIAPGQEKIESLIVQEENELYKNGDLVIDSEEGPLPLSEESLVEAKPAFVVPEDNFVESVIKAVETINLEGSIDSQIVDKESKTVDVVLEADKIPVIESDSNTVLVNEGLIQLEKPEIKSSEITTVQTHQAQSEPIISTKIDSVEDVVPPLPESPIPTFEKLQGIGELLSKTIDESSDLMNNLIDGSSISPRTNDLSEHLDSALVFDPIEELRACHMSSEGLLSSGKETLQELSTSVTDILNVSASPPLVEKITSPTNDDDLPEFPSCPLPAKDISNLLDDLPVPVTQIYNANEEALTCPLPTKDLFNPAKDISDPKISQILQATPDYETIIINGIPVEEALTLMNPSSPKIFDETLVSNPRIPSPLNLVTITSKESSELKLIDDQSNQEFEVESLSQSLNSYNDSDVQLKERLAESEGMNGVENATSCPLLKAVPNAEPDNAQKIAEPEVPENPAEISTTENVIEAPASPAPPVPADLPVLPPWEPAITEDVASVTKAIEETDISDKAVAAAVNEAIESANTNEIVTDSHHQNVINE